MCQSTISIFHKGDLSEAFPLEIRVNLSKINCDCSEFILHKKKTHTNLLWEEKKTLKECFGLHAFYSIYIPMKIHFFF